MTVAILEVVANLATAVGAIVAAIALFYTARGVRRNAKTQEATFWLELRRMLESHDEVHRKLQDRGEDGWYQSDEKPATQEERTKVIPYMGLLEQGKFMLDQGLLDPTIFKKQIGYLVRLILQNGPIKKHLLNIGGEREESFWTTFKKLAVDLGYREMLYDPRGGRWDPKSKSFEPRKSAN